MYAVTTNPVVAYWTVWFLSFPLNALAMHALTWRLTRDHLAATIGGLVYGFCFFRMHHGHDICSCSGRGLFPWCHSRLSGGCSDQPWDGRPSLLHSCSFKR